MNHFASIRRYFNDLISKLIRAFCFDAHILEAYLSKNLIKLLGSDQRSMLLSKKYKFYIKIVKR